MKNLLCKKEFQQLKELQMLKESMDFSNKIGWSDSLVGRAVNKLFSFGAKQVQIMILKRLRVKLEDQYLMAILESYALNDKEIPETEGSNVAVISVKMINKDTNIELEQSNQIEKDENITITYNLPKGKKRDEYKIELTSSDNSTWSFDGKENTQIENIQEENEINVKSENDKVERKYIIRVTEQVEDEDEEEKQQPVLGQGQKSQGGLLKVQATDATIKKVEETIKEEDICYSKYDYSLLAHIDKQVEKQVTYIQKYVSILENAQETEENKTEKANIEIYKERSSNLLSLSEGIKSKMKKVPKKKQVKIEDVDLKKYMENVNKGLSEEEATQKFNELNAKMKQIIGKNLDDAETLKNGWLKHQAPLNPKTTKKYTAQQRFVAYNNIETLFKVYEKISYEEFEKLYESLEVMQPLNEGVGGNYKVRNLFKGYKKTSGLEKNLDKDIGKADLDQMKKDFDSNPQLRQSAIDAVNKETLKEIALRAQWLYDTEKYEDKRNTHYSRVNFTTTNMDQKKLENKWLQYVAKAKSVYAPFFSTDNKMPQELDPIALIKSDETFRKTWNQYSSEDVKSKSGLNDPDSDNNWSSGTLNKCNLEQISSLSDNQIALMEVKTTDGLILSLMLEKHTLKNANKDTFHAYKYTGLFDVDAICKEVEKEDTTEETKIKEIIEKYNYSGKDKIDSKDHIDDNKKQKIKEFYNVLRPTQFNLFMKTVPNYKYGDMTATFFCSTLNIAGGSKMLTQLNIVKDKGAWLSYSKNQKEIASYVKPNDINGYGKFNLDLQKKIYLCNEIDWYSIDSNDKEKTKLLTKDSNLINTIAKNINMKK